MANKSFTVLIVPEHSSGVRRFKISHRRFIQGCLAASVLVAFFAFLMVTYWRMVDEYLENPQIKNDNIVLTSRLRVVQEKLQQIDNSLQQIDQFTSRVRDITQLHDPQRNLAMGPASADAAARPHQVLYAQGEQVEFEDELMDSALAMRLVESQTEAMSQEAIEQQDRAKQLQDFFRDHGVLLDTTPSIRPVHSKFLISPFGMRIDPYTERRGMHKGVDFAADLGADVLAPASGVVVFAGWGGSRYGNRVVLDHGYGLQTHYGHLQDASVVQVGDWVKRGDVIGKVGNTGRTTGVHLHYEIRFNGIPQDPERFILD